MADPQNTFAQIPLRIELGVVSNPSLGPIDSNTGAVPSFWRAQSVRLDFAIFDSNNQSVDLSNLDYFQVIIQRAQADPTVYVNKAIAGDDLIPTVTRAEWLAGVNQQASIVLSAADTDLPLDGETSTDFWMVVRGVTTDGDVLIYGAGPVTAHNPGANPPIVTNNQTVSSHAQVNTSGNATITPTALIHQETVVVNGAARTSILIVEKPISVVGARVDILVLFSSPTVTGITIEVRDGTALGTLLASFTTDGYQPNAAFSLSLGTGLTYVLTQKTIPAYQ